MSSAGYGTAWGTNFGTDNKYKPKKGFSKKALGLGVAAGFVGGAALGVVGTKECLMDAYIGCSKICVLALAVTSQN